jgi:hypothetical protein
VEKPPTTVIFVAIIWLLYVAVAVDFTIGDTAIALDLQRRPDFHSELLPKEIWWLAVAFKLISLVYLTRFAWTVAGRRLPIARFALVTLALLVACVLSSFLAWITTFGALL